MIEFGVGKIRNLTEHLKQSRKVFMLVDPYIFPFIEPLVKALQDGGIQLLVSTRGTPEPPFEVLEELLEPVRKFSPDAMEFNLPACSEKYAQVAEALGIPR